MCKATDVEWYLIVSLLGRFRNLRMSSLLRYDTIGKIELIPSIVLSSDNTKYKNNIQVFLQLFDELSVHRDYH